EAKWGRTSAPFLIGVLLENSTPSRATGAHRSQPACCKVFPRHRIAGDAMPEGTISFEVEAPVERVWAFLSDMRKVGSCVPGVQSVEVLDDKRARWNLQV